MKLYVIRHGRTNNNDEGVFNGRYDEDINETGIMQARKASKQVKKLDINLVISSPLLRTRHTADILNVNNAPVVYDDLLIERDYGSLTGKPVQSVERGILWQYDKLVLYEGVEQVKNLLERVRKCLDNIKQKYPGKNILIVTHSGIARGIYAYFNGIPLDNNFTDYGKHKNCEIREYEW